MFKNYLKITLRNLRKQTGYSAINICGLALGIACCIIMLLFVQSERNFDAFHEKSKRIYRIVESRPTQDGDPQLLGYTFGPVAQALVNEFPEIEKAVRIRDRSGVGRFVIQRGNNRFLEATYLVTEPEFFELFDFRLRRGNPATAISEPNTVVLTEEAAQKYFGDEDPINQSLNSQRWGDLKVTGIIDDLPPDSHLQFNMLISFATLEAIPGWKEFIDSWSSTGFAVYLQTARQLDLATFNPRLEGFLATYRGTDPQVQRQIRLQPLHDIHFGSAEIEFEHNAQKGDITYVYIFSAIAIFVLLIACINYMNLATARFTRRAREIGIRKVAGARRQQIICQILSESIFSTMLSLLLAIAIVQLVLPAFNELAGKSLVLELRANPFISASIIGLVFIVGVFSGSYPALFISNMRPIAIFKDRQSSGFRGSSLRKALVVTQFALSVVMIVSTLVAYRQLHYIRTKNLGFDQEHILVVDINSGAVRRQFDTIKTEMSRVNGVKRVSVSSRIPGEWKNITQIEVAPQGTPDSPALSMYFFAIDQDFLETFDITLLKGRNILSTMGTDTAAVLLNEAAAKALGWSEPPGQEIEIDRVNDRGGYSAKVIGVVKDFHFQSLHETIQPLVMGHWNNPVRVIDYFSCRISPENIAGTLAGLQEVHEKFDHVTPFEFNFLDERLRDFYETDVRMGRIFGISASLAIFIACLGLFGLAAFTTEQRTKEIGVRKVLGASVTNLISLLSGDFLRLVVIANLLAWPMAWYAMKAWLQNFAYTVELNWMIFIVAGGIAALIALLTVSTQAIRAAIANPVEALRDE